MSALAVERLPIALLPAGDGGRKPVVSIVAAYAMFGEVLTPVQMLGGLLVLGGVLLMQARRA